MTTLYLKSTFVKQTYLETRKEDDFGFNAYNEDGSEVYDDYNVLGDSPGLDMIDIDTLISNLQSLKEQGSNYVHCDYNNDHNEIELFGYNLRLATPDEVLETISEDKKRSVKLDRLRELQKEIDSIKKELE